uniref:Gag-pol polyprotein n=1 Tax=Solanum tuberosum TaxID=4113 RepID=M1DAS6_SOLTU
MSGGAAPLRVPQPRFYSFEPGARYHSIHVTRINIQRFVDPVEHSEPCAVRGRPARRNVKEQGVPNTPEVQPQGKVTNAEFREAIRKLS